MNTISLVFEKSKVALAGNPYGHSVFNEQVKGKASPALEKIKIIIPEQIIYVTSSFAQGFFDYWLSTIEKETVQKNVEIESWNPVIIDNIWKNIN